MAYFRSETMPGFTAKYSILSKTIDSVFNRSDQSADNKLNLVPQWSVRDIDQCAIGEGWGSCDVLSRQPYDGCEAGWVILCDGMGGRKCWHCTG